MSLSTNDFNYNLPEHLIAQHPLAERTASRLMLMNRSESKISHQTFSDILSYINPEDLLVLNNTKVIPARLWGCKETGGQVECLIERVLPNREAYAHIRSSKSPKANTRIYLADKQITATVLGRAGELFHLHFEGEGELFETLEQFGHMPLPPYIERDDALEDRDRYQTVFAQHKGAVAAPTAGLHFDDVLLSKIREQGTATIEVTLHVGAGTFQPVRVDDVTDHKMHSEWIEVSTDVISSINACRDRGGRVIAVGTTVVRALETAALKPYSGETDIFIYPGYQFNTVDAMLTNFHLPKSTLLMLVSAFAGRDFVREAYEAAVSGEYRFFSYGDAMLII